MEVCPNHRRRTALALGVIEVQLAQDSFHIADAFPVIVAGIGRSLFGHFAHLADESGIPSVIWEPPVIDFGELPDSGEGGSELWSNHVPNFAEL